MPLFGPRAVVVLVKFISFFRPTSGTKADYLGTCSNRSFWGVRVKKLSGSTYGVRSSDLMVLDFCCAFLKGGASTTADNLTHRATGGGGRGEVMTYFFVGTRKFSINKHVWCRPAADLLGLFWPLKQEIV